MQLPKDIIHFFAQSHIPIRWQLESLKDELTADLKSRMDELMHAIPEQVVQARLTHPDYQGTHDDSTDDDTEWDTRKEILIGLISRQTNQVRIRMLHNDSGQDRVAPYDHEALLDLDVDEDNLVALDQFELKNRRFERKGYVFELALTLLAENSSYWLKKNLLALADKVSMAVRLDPLAIQSQSEYREAMYKMGDMGCH